MASESKVEPPEGPTPAWLRAWGKALVKTGTHHLDLDMVRQGKKALQEAEAVTPVPQAKRKITTVTAPPLSAPGHRSWKDAIEQAKSSLATELGVDVGAIEIAVRM